MTPASNHFFIIGFAWCRPYDSSLDKPDLTGRFAAVPVPQVHRLSRKPAVPLAGCGGAERVAESWPYPQNPLPHMSEGYARAVSTEPQEARTLPRLIVLGAFKLKCRHLKKILLERSGNVFSVKVNTYVKTIRGLGRTVFSTYFYFKRFSYTPPFFTPTAVSGVFRPRQI